MKKTGRRTGENIKTAATVFLIFVLSRLLLTFVACAYNYMTQGYAKTWDLLYKFDALWYVDIAENGYQSVPNSVTGYANYAFYPFYPIVLRFMKCILPDRFTTNQIGVIVSNLCTLIAGYVAVQTVRIKYAEDKGYFIAFLIFFAPHTIYFSMTYTEAMFLMFTALFFIAVGESIFFWRQLLPFLPRLPELPEFFWYFHFCCFSMRRSTAGV